MCCRGRGLVLAGLYKIVQVEVACDERGGLAVRLINNWLGERRQAQEGQRRLDDVSRLTEAVRRQVPQLRYARAERRGVERAADEVAQR